MKEIISKLDFNLSITYSIIIQTDIVTERKHMVGTTIKELSNNNPYIKNIIIP